MKSYPLYRPGFPPNFIDPLLVGKSTFNPKNKGKNSKTRIRRRSFPFEYLHQRDGIRYYKCHYCPGICSEFAITRDHKYPKYLRKDMNFRTGNPEWRKILPACPDCNQRKGEMLYEDFVKLKEQGI